LKESILDIVEAVFLLIYSQCTRSTELFSILLLSKTFVVEQENVSINNLNRLGPNRSREGKMRPSFQQLEKVIRTRWCCLRNIWRSTNSRTCRRNGIKAKWWGRHCTFI